MLRHIWTCHLISYTCGSFPTSFSVSKGTRLHFQYQITFFRTVYCINVLITACLRATSVVVWLEGKKWNLCALHAFLLHWAFEISLDLESFLTKNYHVYIPHHSPFYYTWYMLSVEFFVCRVVENEYPSLKLVF